MRKHFLLIYHYAPDYIERRAEFRSHHLALAAKASDAGDLILGGALLLCLVAAAFFWRNRQICHLFALQTRLQGCRPIAAQPSSKPPQTQSSPLVTC